MIRFVLPLLPLLLALLALACGEQEIANTDASIDPNPDAATSGTSLSFDPPTTIMLPPGASHEVSILVDPPDVHMVRFSLVGDSLDASLDADKRLTNSSGRTFVTLTAPSATTTFQLRASAGGSAVAEVAVSVSDEGFASLRILPSYKGIRETLSWTASAIAHVGCSDIPGEPPEDGPIVNNSLGKGPIELHGLPVGPRIAVTLRSQRAVGGCMEVPDLNPGEVRDISVKVSDIPVNLAATDLNVAVAISPDGSQAWPSMQSLSDSFLDVLFPPTQTEANTVLDLIESQITDAESFSEARLWGGWDALLSAWIDENGKPLRQRVFAWIETGFEPLRSGETFKGRLTSADAAASHGLLSLESFHGLPLASSGVPRDHIVSLGVEPNDIMIVGGKVSWLPSKLIAAAADRGADDAVESNAIQALIHSIPCQSLATLFESTYPLPTTCDADCIESACTAGIISRWNLARLDSSNSHETGQLSFTISGTATVNGNIVIVAFDSIWAGMLTIPGQETPLRGVATGTQQGPRIY